VESTISIVIPAYNEAKRIPRTLDHILSFLGEKGWKAEVIVVNDGSTDETAGVVRGYCTRHSSVRLIDNPVNAGKGSAIRDGVLHATGDIILFTDADDSTPIEDADKLIAAICEGSDIVIGSRWVDPNLQSNPQPWYRRLNGRLYNLLLRTILGLDLTDTQRLQSFHTHRRKGGVCIAENSRMGLRCGVFVFREETGILGPRSARGIYLLCGRFEDPSLSRRGTHAGGVAAGEVVLPHRSVFQNNQPAACAHEAICERSCW
jgi:glycosyltransferase involved in cell wall biosynthesis